jgi:polyisoprenoid-binding protein YceI
MHRSLLLLLFAGIVVFGVACSNPADGVAEAEVSEASDAATTDAGSDAEGVTYALAEGSKVEFTGSKVTGSHDGGFNAFTGEVTVVDNDPTRSSVAVTIDMNSMWSDNDRLTGHLKSADFFEVETYPETTFRSTAIRATDDGYEIEGDLTMHGVTKSITFPAAIEMAEGEVRASAEFFVKRFDWNIVYPGKPDDLIRDEVVIRLDLVATPAA